MYCCQLWFNSTKGSIRKFGTSYNSAYVQYRSAALYINLAFRAGACTDCEYIECTIAIIIIVILVRSLFLVDIAR